MSAGIQRKVQNPVSDLSGTEITDGVRNISWLPDFVKSQVGVDNVCERAAMKAAGADGRICRAKQAQDGMTVAIAEKAWKVSM